MQLRVPAGADPVVVQLQRCPAFLTPGQCCPVQGYFLAALLFLGIVFSLPMSLGMYALALDLPVNVNEALAGLVMPASAYVLLGKSGAPGLSASAAVVRASTEHSPCGVRVTARTSLSVAHICSSCVRSPLGSPDIHALGPLRRGHPGDRDCVHGGDFQRRQ